jgi:catechol 2,3-dioxygenase-like lactoylglutathione lyase family enzyme
MLGHISFGVSELERAARFYDAALAPIGFVRVWTDPDGVGYGPPGNRDKFAIFARAGATPPGEGFHLAFDAASRTAVDDFHAAALAAGGTDNGGPGLRSQYGPTYYAAFVVDPDGHRLEAVHQ